MAVEGGNTRNYIKNVKIWRYMIGLYAAEREPDQASKGITLK